MSPDLENKLFERYPHIFRRGEGFSHITHLEISDGWFNLIDVLCSTIQSHIDNLRYRSNGPAEIDVVSIHATQVKEKWGGLRFYVSGGDDFIWGAIANAENMSYRICEVCGKPGSSRRSSWIQTLCDEHASPKPSS